MSVMIHGKEYITVAERIAELHKTYKGDTLNISTEILQHDPVVIVKATIIMDNASFTGMSAANPAKTIEKQSPYEVAETSAVGRALGFAGFGMVEGNASIATADEIQSKQTDIPAKTFIDESSTVDPHEFDAIERASEHQIGLISNLILKTRDGGDKYNNLEEFEEAAQFKVADLSKQQASQLIERLLKRINELNDKPKRSAIDEMIGESPLNEA